MSAENNFPIEMRSEPLQDIISYRPHWLVRRGMGFFLVILLLLLAGSYFIEYPEVVIAPFRLTAVNAPKAIYAQTNSKVVSLLVKNGQKVKVGQHLAFLESTTDPAQVLSLSSLLKQIKDQTENSAPYLNELSFSQLGELQGDYQTFLQAYRQYLALGEKGYYSKQLALLNKEITDMAGLEKTLHNQLRIYKQDLAISQQEYDIQKRLAEELVIAPLELRREKSKLLSKQLPLEQINASLFANRFSQSEKQKQILELERITSEGQSIFVESLHSLQSAIEAWKKRFIISAPLGGRVTYALLLEEKQTVSAHQELFYITTQSSAYYGEVFVPQQNLGKVKKGQRVLIKFKGYPFAEFGYVEGRIDYLSEIVSNQNTFLAK